MFTRSHLRAWTFVRLRVVLQKIFLIHSKILFLSILPYASPRGQMEQSPVVDCPISVPWSPKFAGKALARSKARGANHCPRIKTLWRSWALILNPPSGEISFPQNLPFSLSLSFCPSLVLLFLYLCFPSFALAPTLEPWISQRDVCFFYPAFAWFQQSIWKQLNQATM